MLAINGGKPEVTIPKPHVIWPPKATTAELSELMGQRNKDISIKGRSGPIGEMEDLFNKVVLKNKAKHVVSFNSGTSALFAAYNSLEIGRAHEVIGPAVTYHAALSPLFTLGAKPVLVDVDKTWCIDPDKIVQAITHKTKAITVVHQWGYPAKMDEIMKIARQYALYVIEDCSHAHGATYKGTPVGLIGDVGVYSMQAAKIVFAGEGGVLVTGNSQIHDRAVLTGHYRDRSRDEIKDPYLQKFWVTGYGMKLRMSPYNAITAKHSIMAFKKRNKQRNEAMRYMLKRLATVPNIIVPEDHEERSWYGFKPLYVGQAPIEKYIEALQSEGVKVKKPGSPPLATLPLYRYKSITRGATLQTMNLTSCSLSLPTFSNWPEDKEVIDQYISAFIKVSKELT